ncbi:hypothetical protein Pmani_023535 [Petrolisthes manimaculis]|uniref:Zinc finger CCHC domain-containing protein 7 n=1 Tax=Petrolisthes manimaculis TaxID=1843537 RepID=A0AAE1U394_9EUCA|nr:hypothetical protein Pmani_023535 [Petrolisthes manimaculis]
MDVSVAVGAHRHNDSDFQSEDEEAEFLLYTQLYFLDQDDLSTNCNNVPDQECNIPDDNVHTNLQIHEGESVCTAEKTGDVQNAYITTDKTTAEDIPVAAEKTPMEDVSLVTMEQTNVKYVSVVQEKTSKRINSRKRKICDTENIPQEYNEDDSKITTLIKLNEKLKNQEYKQRKKPKPDTKTKPSCDKWSQEMTNFYDSDVSEECDVSDIHQQQSDSPADWSIISGDYWSYLNKSNRYYSKERCTLCREFGHSRNNCNKVAHCYLCSKTDHSNRRDCPHNCCFKCGGPFHHFCAYTLRSVTCTRCGFSGHRQEQCPVNWRIYHVTVSGRVAMTRECEPTRKIYCCHCSRKGHFNYMCTQWHHSVNTYLPVPQAIFTPQSKMVDYVKAMEGNKQLRNEDTTHSTDHKLQKISAQRFIDKKQKRALMANNEAILKELEMKSGTKMQIESVKQRGVVYIEGTNDAVTRAVNMLKTALKNVKNVNTAFQTFNADCVKSLSVDMAKMSKERKKYDFNMYDMDTYEDIDCEPVSTNSGNVPSLFDKKVEHLMALQNRKKSKKLKKIAKAKMLKGSKFSKGKESGTPEECEITVLQGEATHNNTQQQQQHEENIAQIHTDAKVNKDQRLEDSPNEKVKINLKKEKSGKDKKKKKMKKIKDGGASSSDKTQECNNIYEDSPQEQPLEYLSTLKQKVKSGKVKRRRKKKKDYNSYKVDDDDDNVDTQLYNQEFVVQGEESSIGSVKKVKNLDRKVKNEMKKMKKGKRLEMERQGETEKKEKKVKKNKKVETEKKKVKKDKKVIKDNEEETEKKKVKREKKVKKDQKVKEAKKDKKLETKNKVPSEEGSHDTQPDDEKKKKKKTKVVGCKTIKKKFPNVVVVVGCDTD